MNTSDQQSKKGELPKGCPLVAIVTIKVRAKHNGTAYQPKAVQEAI